MSTAGAPRVLYTPSGRRGPGSRPGLLRHRELIGQLVRRELGRRYRGRWLGLFWLVLQPLLLLSLYTFVFGLVFGARWPGFESQETLGFAIVVFVGLITFGIFADVTNAAPGLILANRALMKNVDFPAEVLPIVSVLCALVQALAGLAILLIGLVSFAQPIPPTAALLPLVWLPLALFSLGTSYLLSSIGVFVRDLDGVVGLLVTGLLFGSAIFYPLTQVPEAARAVLAWLPTCIFVDATRQVLLYEQPSFSAQQLVLAAGTGVFACFGFWIFVRSKGSFADVL